MKLRIALTAVITLAAGLAAPPAQAAPPTLAGTTVVTGSSTAGMRVRLTRSISLPLDRRGQVRISGNGRTVGIVLTRADLAEPMRPTYAYVRFGFCTKPGCRAKETHDGPIGFNPGEGGRLRLTPGDYQLYVVADGSPVTATISLPGLPGTTRLRPGVRNRFGPRTPTVRSPAGSSNVYGAGDMHEFGGFGGLSLQAIGLNTGPWVAGEVGDCVYGTRPPVEQAAFQPRCPGGAGATVVDGVVTALTIHRQYYFNAYLRVVPGLLGHGAWFVAAGNVTEVAIPSLQLELDTIR